MTEDYDVFGSGFNFTPQSSVFGDSFVFDYIDVVTHPRGRQSIGYDQPAGGGANYPFVLPAYDIDFLLADLFVSFEDPNNEVKYPLRVAWMFGFGSHENDQIPGYPVPWHEYDMLIVDANNRTVFDSTYADEPTQHLWDNRLLVIEWQAPFGVLRAVQHVAWAPEDLQSNVAREYDLYIVPESGEINLETYYRLPKRVNSLTVGLTTARGNGVVLQEGYNCQISAVPPEEQEPLLDLGDAGQLLSKATVPGTRVATQLVLSAEPGQGLGVFPGCAETTNPNIISFNDVPVSGTGNFTIEVGDCIRVQRPVGLHSTTPLRLRYTGIGSSAMSRAALEFNNDCTPCCDCEDFARVYQGIKKQWFLYQDMATAAEEARDNYAAGVARWEEQKVIRERNMLRVITRSDGNNKISWGFSFCNASKCCVVQPRVIMTWLYYVNGSLTPPVVLGYDCHKTKIDGTEQKCTGPEDTTLQQLGTNPDGRVFEGNWGYSDPQSVTLGYGRNCFPEGSQHAEQELKVKLHVALAWDSSFVNNGNDPSSACEPLELSVEDLPADVLATWAEVGYAPVGLTFRSQKTGDLQVVRSSSRYCDACPCEPSP